MVDGWWPASDGRWNNCFENHNSLCERSLLDSTLLDSTLLDCSLLKDGSLQLGCYDAEL